MKILRFFETFPDEDSCRLHWREHRETEGIFCKKCGGTNHLWKENQQYWDCTQCHHHTGLRAGTIMQSSKLPFRDWYIAMHLITSTKHAFSAKELQRELDRKRYEPCWGLFQKLRYVMGKSDEKLELNDFVEIDDAFFTTFDNMTKVEREEILQSTVEIKLKRGRGSQKKTTVLVMAESKPLSEEEEEQAKAKKRSKKRKFGKVRMVVIPDLKKETVNEVVEETVKETSEVRTDGSNSFNDLKTKIKSHEFKILNSSKDVNEFLPWVHTMIANAKRMMLGIYFKIGKGYLQQYLDEFCFKVNRRYSPEKIFDSLVVSGINCGHTDVNSIRFNYFHLCG